MIEFVGNTDGDDTLHFFRSMASNRDSGCYR